MLYHGESVESEKTLCITTLSGHGKVRQLFLSTLARRLGMDLVGTSAQGVCTMSGIDIYAMGA